MRRSLSGSFWRLTFAALLTIGTSGCSASGFQSVSKKTFEEHFGRYEDALVRFTLSKPCELRPVSLGDLDPSVAAMLPPGIANGKIFVVAEASSPSPLVQCAVRRTAHSTGGAPGPTIRLGDGRTVQTPGTPRVTTLDYFHASTFRIVSEHHEFANDYAVVRVGIPAADGTRYFARREGIENVFAGGVGLPPAHAVRWMHPGYAQIRKSFWAVVPLEFIERYAVSTRGDDGSTGPDTFAESGGYLGSGLAYPLNSDSELAAEAGMIPKELARPACENIDDRIDYMSVEGRWIVGGSTRTRNERITALHAPYRALCLAADGNDTGAIALINSTLLSMGESMPWTHDDYLSLFVASFLVHIAQGSIDSAARAAGHILHLQGPEFVFPVVAPSGDSLPPGPLQDFVAARQEVLRETWPKLFEHLSPAFFARMGLWGW